MRPFDKPRVIGKRHTPNRRVVSMKPETITTMETPSEDPRHDRAVTRTYDRSYHVTKGYRRVLVREEVL